MERRREPRSLLDRSVQVTLLRVAGGGPPQEQSIHSFQAQTIDQSGRGMRLLVPLELPPGTSLKIETDESLMLAEVCHCTRVNEERFAVGVQVEQALHFNEQLRKLSNAVAPGSREPVPVR